LGFRWFFVLFLGYDAKVAVLCKVVRDVYQFFVRNAQSDMAVDCVGGRFLTGVLVDEL
jgi:hypothetical protein